MADYSVQFPIEFASWQKNSNTVVALNCKNEDYLFYCWEDLRNHAIQRTMFFEPDINEYTALATILNKDQWPLFSKLQLALYSSLSVKGGD